VSLDELVQTTPAPARNHNTNPKVSAHIFFIFSVSISNILNNLNKPSQSRLLYGSLMIQETRNCVCVCQHV